jgi:hypothetical protein
MWAWHKVAIIPFRARRILQKSLSDWESFRPLEIGTSYDVQNDHLVANSTDRKVAIRKVP